MKRRDVLRRIGAIGVVGTAGCLSEGPGDPGDGTDSPTSSPSPTPELRLTGKSFEVLSQGPGTGENEARVSFDDGVTVEGTIGGNNGCYTAELKEAPLDGDQLTVVVLAKEEEGSEMCTQSLVDIDYEASFSFEGGLPGTVVVKHVSLGKTRTVATESP